MINTWVSRITSGLPQYGLWAASGSSYITEICAGSGADWLLVDQEHVPNDVRSVLSQLQTLAAYPDVEVVVRPPAGDAVYIKQLLDIGVQNLIIPMVDTPEQAAHVVAATRYPPRGIRGVGSALARASRWNRVPDYLATADDGLSVTVQVESVEGLANLSQIASVDGVDAVFIGPADLAASLGRLGQPEHADVVNRIEGALAEIVAQGKPAGVNAFNRQIAERYLAAGATFVLVGADVALVARGAEAVVSQYKGAQ
ncbi:2,4-dihydroxyhept-2-ene-1,7-dioic acid aldolase [Mycolicibacterium anyangense]|uniref:2,4-dihydroxyhept-2-ene-1,7-dioic acid aldolase n=1 Tax=Mycolicibacterium anyangense TaxID=1431246 RepID=A0A6N4WAM9_9MYCO|nr:2,4-dihydroxyhept-2-ene-1,7-dioic acid aldolase [Mycolicibacterium anyangense]